MMALHHCILLLTLVVQTSAYAPPLQLHFYAQSCPQAEAIVRRVVQRRAAQDRSVLPALIRLHFHDCFVRGCDGSVLVDSTGGNVAEKEAAPNMTLRMLDVIDDIKAALEKACPGVVSCADIIALAARDAAAMAGRVRYQLPTGRRDGTVSSAAEVHLPSPSVSFADALAAFRNINLDVVDLTTLLGSHTMGFCHCGFIMDRLYHYNKSTAASDHQAMDAGLRAALQRRCPPHAVTPQNESRDATVPMNFLAPRGPFSLDNSFYPSVLAGKAVLQIDQQLVSSGMASQIAAMFAVRPAMFRKQFARSMVKLGSVNVLTGGLGQVRQNCRKVNS